MAFAAALAALLLVAGAPTGAHAHGRPHAHAAPAKHATVPHLTDRDTARTTVVADLRNPVSVPADQQSADDCGVRGCCSNGHCSGCGTAIAPTGFVSFRLPADIILLNPDATPPAGLAREGPARPPKSFV